jgi:hypothetical protein
VVHQVGRAGDARRGEGERVDKLRLSARRRRNRRTRAVLVEVVGKPYRDAAVDRTEDRAFDRVGERFGEPKVIDCDVEALLCLREPVREQASDVLSLLAAVGERVDVYRAAFARSSALCARFAAW